MRGEANRLSTKRSNKAEARACINCWFHRVAYHCVQLHGGNGYMEEYKISRAAVDVRMGSIVAGTTEVMKTIIARMMGL